MALVLALSIISIILLKSNKLYKIKNASDPTDVCDILWKIKKQRKYK